MDFLYKNKSVFLVCNSVCNAGISSGYFPGWVFPRIFKNEQKTTTHHTYNILFLALWLVLFMMKSLKMLRSFNFLKLLKVSCSNKAFSSSMSPSLNKKLQYDWQWCFARHCVLNLKLQGKLRFKTFYWFLNLVHTTFVLITAPNTVCFTWN